jgi:hypothetical protein
LVIVVAQVLSLSGQAQEVTAQSVSGPSRSGPARKVIVDTGDRETAAILASRGGRILEEYGAFALWSVPQPELPSVQSRAGATVRDDLDSIGLRGGASIDTRTGAQTAPTAAAGLRQTRVSGSQFWIVQFVGPIKERWLTELRTAGLELVMYMPQNAYVVWGDGSALVNLDVLARKSTVIQFTGPYEPSYRLAPALQQGPTGTVPVTVQFYTTRAVDQSVARLRSLGGQVYREPSTVRTLTSLSLDLPAGQLTAVASWPDVFNVEPYTAPTKNVESQGQTIAGNLGIVHTWADFLVPVTGEGKYLAWLASKGFPTTPESYPIVDIVDDGIDNGEVAPAHQDFYVLGAKTNSDRLVYNQNCSSDPRANGGAGHGTLNASIAGGYSRLNAEPYQDGMGFRLGTGISPYGRLAGTKILKNSGPSDISRCQSSYAGIVQASFESGATITSNSWGHAAAGWYDSGSQAYDALTRDASATTAGNQQMLHVFSAGNDGRQGASTVGSPATAKNVLTVGASEGVRYPEVRDGCLTWGASGASDMTAFSSRGPTVDGHAKPDIVAPGSHIQGAASQDPEYDGSGICGAQGNYSHPHVPGTEYYPPGQTLYTWSSGTSHAAPAVAGAASLVSNYDGRILKPGQTPSPAMLKALLLSTPRYLDGVNATVPPAAILNHASIDSSDTDGNNNDAIDIGETVALQVGMQNDGDGAATAVRGSLAVLNGNATLLNGKVVYPDMAPHAAGTSTKPYYFQVAPTQACGSTVTFRHTVSLNGGLPSLQDIPIRVGKLVPGGPPNHASTDVPKTIPDNTPAGVAVNLPISGVTGEIVDVNVRVSVSHFWVSDIALELVSPKGTVVSLANRRGGTAEDYSGTVFDDEAPRGITTGSAPFAGSFRPEQPLLQAASRHDLGLADHPARRAERRRDGHPRSLLRRLWGVADVRRRSLGGVPLAACSSSRRAAAPGPQAGHTIDG